MSVSVGVSSVKVNVRKITSACVSPHVRSAFVPRREIEKNTQNRMRKKEYKKSVPLSALPKCMLIPPPNPIPPLPLVTRLSTLYQKRNTQRRSRNRHTHAYTQPFTTSNNRSQIQTPKQHRSKFPEVHSRED